MATPELAAQVAAVRRFTRFYARQVGHLQNGLLQSPFSLTQAHVLYELAHRDRATASEIGHDLGLDAGYLSRILRRFQQLGLVTKTPSDQDGRQSLLALTERGRQTFAPLDRRSNELAATMLRGLSERDQDRFVGAMQTVEGLLRGPGTAKPSLRMRTHRPGDMGWIVSRHSVLYMQDYGWDETFEGYAAEIAATFLKNFDPERERCWIAEVDGERVGSAALASESTTVARLRLLFLEPRARGLGIGRKLVDECICFARATGYRSILLSTYSILAAARGIYSDAGFRLVRKQKQRAYGHNLIDETWQLTL